VGWWTQGRTHFPDPNPYPPTGWEGWVPTGEFPRVEEGALVIEHHLYNPYDSPDDDHLFPRTFLGGEVHTAQTFDPNQAYRFEARVRLDQDPTYVRDPAPPYVPYPNGLVTSFFLYGYDEANRDSDEVDFEFLSNQMNIFDPNRDPVLTNTFNDSRANPEKVMPDGLDLTDWNTFRIYWYPDNRQVDWTWVIDPGVPDEREVLLRTERDSPYVPDESMSLYFNFWAPCYTSWNPNCHPWDDAADRGLQAVNERILNEISAYEIDYVEVRVPEPQSVIAAVIGVACLLGRRRRR
jgi:hypothetical protein